MRNLFGAARPHSCISLSVLFLVAGLAASGCRDAQDAGATRLEALPELVATPGLRIGSVDDPSAGFTGIGDMEVDEEGSFWVSETSVPEIRVYGRDGRLLRRIGRRGDGPGEFRRLNWIGVHGDSVWAYDSGPRRLTVFDRSGALLSTASIAEAAVQLTNGVALAGPAIPRSDGTIMGRLDRLQYAGGNPDLVSSPSEPIPVPLVRFALSGDVVDTLGWAERPPPGLWRPASEEPSLPGSVEVGGRRFIIPDPPSTLSDYLQLADGYAMVHRPQPSSGTGLVSVVRMGVGGDTIYHREVAYEAPAYTGAELDSIAARATRGVGLSMTRVGETPPPVENPEAATNRIRAAMSFPEFQLPIERSWAGDDGSLWIAHRAVDADTTTWLVLDPDGTPRGRLRLPRAVRPIWHRGDTLFASVPDELDVPWLVQYELGDRSAN